MKVTRKFGNLVVAIAFASGLLMASHASISAHTSQPASALPTLKMGYLANNPKWVPTLDPQMVTDTASSVTARLMNANLVQLSNKARVIPDLASHWTLSKNRKTYTFFLRSNARFSNGHQVTAQDVVFSIRRALSKETNSPVNYYDSLIAGYDAYSTGKSTKLGVKAVNKTAVQITLSQPAVYFLNALTYPTNDILDPTAVGGHPADTYLTTTCKANVGAGPFKPVCATTAANDVTSFYHAGSTPTLTLVPNPYYYGHKPRLKLVLPTIDSDDTAYADYLAGGLNESRLPTAYISKWKGKTDFYHYPSSGIEYLAPDLTTPPFNNEHCRLAVAYAIDRTTLTQKVLHGAYSGLYGMLPKGFLGYYSGGPRFNLQRAHQELAKCPGGIHVTAAWRNDTADRRAEGDAVQGMLQTAGIDVKLKSLSRADWLKIVQQPLAKTGTKLVYDDWFMDYPDPQDYVDILLHSKATYNVQGWSNSAFDHLVEQGRVETNTKKRAQLYIQAQKMVLGKGVFIGMTNFGNFNLIKPNVHGFVGDYAQGDVWPKNDDWSNVTITK